LLMSVDADSLLRDLNTQFRDELLTQGRDAKLRTPEIQVSATNITLGPGLATELSDWTSLARKLAAEKNDRGQPYSIEAQQNSLVLTVNPLYRQTVVAEATEQSVDVVRRRLDESGLVEPSISRQGEDRL